MMEVMARFSMLVREFKVHVRTLLTELVEKVLAWLHTGMGNDSTGDSNIPATRAYSDD